MRILIALGFSILAGILPAAHAADISLAEAINKAGRQRMLAQRIVKSYCQVGLGVNEHGSREELAEAVRLFDAQLGELRAYPAAVGVEDLEGAWKAFRATAVAPVSREGAARLMAASVPLVDLAERLTRDLQRGGGAVSRLVNLSGRQRMLSQRMAKTYMLFAWGLGDGSLLDEMRDTGAEFEKALSALRAAPENTGALRKELEAAAMQWEWLAASAAQYDHAAYPLVVADASEAILRRMERITLLYERLAAR